MRKIKRLTIKIGSNILSDGQGINAAHIRRIADAVCRLKERVKDIIIVSSGSIAAGFRALGFPKRPTEVIDKQASASVGQTRLMWAYEKAFAEHSRVVAQILVTKYDFSARERYLNAKGTINRLLSLGAVPIINENDTIVVNELKYVESFGDNDNLGALVAGLTDSDMLMILSDVDGLYTTDPSKDPGAELIAEVSAINRQVMAMTGDSSSAVGTGGMYSKLNAAKKALNYGCSVVILNGREPENMLRFVQGERVGTFFPKSGKSAASRKLWVKYATIPQGAVVIDDGAREAVCGMHRSLLTSGVVSVEGEFRKGDVVIILDTSGQQVAVGRVRYSSTELGGIKRKTSAELTEILGRKASGIVIHCDDMSIKE